MTRGQEIAANLVAAQERIARACEAAGRDAADITLIAVTKTWPASDIRILADLGITHIGESKEQEGHSKFQEVSDLPVTWHFIGQIQRNKAKRIAQWATIIHSVDRAELVPLLGTRQALIQVNLDPAASGRGGVEPDRVIELARAITSSPLALKGVMAVAPLGQEPDRCFAQLREVRDQIVAQFPGADWISAGMSGDLESAIAHGATHVRLGSSILGSRQ